MRAGLVFFVQPALEIAQALRCQPALNAAIIEKANKAIKILADAEKYDLIVQDVVWVSPKLDVTDKIIKALSESK